MDVAVLIACQQSASVLLHPASQENWDFTLDWIFSGILKWQRARTLHSTHNSTKGLDVKVYLPHHQHKLEFLYNYAPYHIVSQPACIVAVCIFYFLFYFDCPSFPCVVMMWPSSLFFPQIWNYPNVAHVSCCLPALWCLYIPFLSLL